MPAVIASCHCGAVRIEAAEPPQTVTDCNCSACRRYGALWAYYQPAQVRIAGATDTYMWGDRMLAFHRCKVCGNTTHWSATDKSGAPNPAVDRMGINARLLPPEILATVRIRKFDGAETWKVLDEG